MKRKKRAWSFEVINLMGFWVIRWLYWNIIQVLSHFQSFFFLFLVTPKKNSQRESHPRPNTHLQIITDIYNVLGTEPNSSLTHNSMLIGSWTWGQSKMSYGWCHGIYLSCFKLLQHSLHENQKEKRGQTQAQKQYNGCKNLDFTLFTLLDLWVFIPIFTTLPQDEENHFCSFIKTSLNSLWAQKDKPRSVSSLKATWWIKYDWIT